MQWIGISLFLVVTWVAAHTVAFSQRGSFRGPYVVNVDSTHAVSDAEPPDTVVLHYGDTIQVTSRRGSAYLADVSSMRLLVPVSAVIRAASFNTQITQPQELLDTVLRDVVIVDSAIVRTSDGTIWLPKGTLVDVTGEVDSTTLRILINQQSALIARRDVGKRQSVESRTIELTRGHSTRISLGFGVARPLSYDRSWTSTLSTAFSVDFALARPNTFIQADIEFNTFERTNFSEIRQARYWALHGSLFYGFGSTTQKLIPYIRPGLGVVADLAPSDLYLSAVVGLGTEYYLAEDFVVFVDIQPTIVVVPFAWLAVPIRSGIRLAF